jgi:serine/threonine-protein kinase
LAYSHGEIGWVLRNIGEHAKALTAFERALPILQKLVAAHPTVVAFQRRLAFVLNNMGWFREQTGRTADAAACWRQAVAMLERLPMQSGAVLYNIACTYAHLSNIADLPGSGMTAAEGRFAAEQAMQWLHRAVARGYRNVALMRKDPDLDPVRSRPDFQLLMMDLEFPDDPFARGG